jgi:tetraacyldisaccharide 4'-kinase
LGKRIAHFRNLIAVFRKAIAHFGNPIAVFRKAIAHFGKRIAVFRKPIAHFGKRIAVFRKPIAHFSKGIAHSRKGNPIILPSFNLSISSPTMQSLRLLLLPLAWLYGVITWFRNWLYNIGILPSVKFPEPVISVGNLTTGGTGKTPHIEYLIRLLKNKMKVGTVSRGYGRTTKGFMLVSDPSTAAMIGDEPMQYHHKFPDITVAVCEDRVAGVGNLLYMQQKPDVILLDDAFQHRAVKPGLSILLIDFHSIIRKNYMLPAGTMREWKSGMKRADIIIITKSPDILIPIERHRVLSKIKVREHQHIFFSFFKYDELVRLSHKHVSSIFFSTSYYFEKRFAILLVAGIANPSGMFDYLRRRTDKIDTMFYSDHHRFTISDMNDIKEKFKNILSPNKIIVTTEKDAMRILSPELEQEVEHLPIFYLPIRVAFHQPDEEKFDKIILDYVRENKTDGVIH